jgi:hypothetical protein
MPVTRPKVATTTPVVATTTPVVATAMPVEGTVTRVDPPQQVIVLDNGQMYRVVGDQAVMVNGDHLAAAG